MPEGELYQTFLLILRRVMCAVMVIDEEICDREISTIQRVFREFSGQDIDVGQLRREMYDDNLVDPLEALRKIEPLLSTHAKEIILKASLIVADADGKILKEEELMIAKIGAFLGLSPAHVRGIVCEMIE
jgi:tellurite resistance protein